MPVLLIFILKNFLNGCILFLYWSSKYYKARMKLLKTPYYYALTLPA